MRPIQSTDALPQIEMVSKIHYVRWALSFVSIVQPSGLGCDNPEEFPLPLPAESRSKRNSGFLLPSRLIRWVWIFLWSMDAPSLSALLFFLPCKPSVFGTCGKLLKVQLWPRDCVLALQPIVPMSTAYMNGGCSWFVMCLPSVFHPLRLNERQSS